jgi:hypothetical protein
VTKTLEIKSVVKYPTFLDPRLVSEVQQSSHTILHCYRGQIYWHRKASVQPRGFPAGGCTTLRRSIQSEVRRKIFGKGTYGFSLYGLGNHLYSIQEEVVPTDYFLELGTTWRREWRTAEEGFHHLVAQIFIDHIETSPVGFSWPSLSFW